MAKAVIQFIELENFTTHDCFRLDLPQTGLVVIIGPNGVGKSSLVEAVAWGLWGQSLRGTGRGSWVPWREGANPPCTVRLGLGEITIERKRRGAKTSLRLDEQDKFATVTNAQPRVDALVGSFEAWRKSHVFSSADAAHFALASDKERKDLLESMCGLATFDTPLEKCKEDKRNQENKIRDIEALITCWESQSKLAQQRIVTAQEELSFLKAPDPVEKPTEDVSQIAIKLHSVQNSMRTLQKEVRAIEENEERLRASGICPTCGQALPGLPTKGNHEHDTRGINERKNQLSSELDVLAAEESRESKAWYEARMREDQYRRFVAESERYSQAHARWEKAERDGKSELSRLAEKEQILWKELSASKRDLLLANLAEQAMQGTRGAVLGRTLGGIEGLANALLAQVPVQPLERLLQVALRPYSERKDGRLADAISLDVIGAGGSSGYTGCSGGERRRVDVTMVLGFAALAGGNSPLWFDEVFDTLDPVGSSGVAKVLQDLAVDRCVVVITHSKDLLAFLPKARYVVVG